MAIALLFEKFNNEDDEMFPIATQKTFLEFWSPVCTKHNLDWIKLFETGLTIQEEDRPFILEDLGRFNEIIEREKMRNTRYEEIQQRVINLIELLKHKKISDFKSISIG